MSFFFFTCSLNSICTISYYGYFREHFPTLDYMQKFQNMQMLHPLIYSNLPTAHRAELLPQIIYNRWAVKRTLPLAHYKIKYQARGPICQIFSWKNSEFLNCDSSLSKHANKRAIFPIMPYAFFFFIIMKNLGLKFLNL